MNQRRILVAYDGTEEAYWALMHAADAALANDAAIGVVTVSPALATAAAEPAEILREHELEAAVHTPIGDPATEIARVAEEHAYDAIYVGRREDGSLARALEAACVRRGRPGVRPDDSHRAIAAAQIAPVASPSKIRRMPPYDLVPASRRPGSRPRGCASARLRRGHSADLAPSARRPGRDVGALSPSLDPSAPSAVPAQRTRSRSRPSTSGSSQRPSRSRRPAPTRSPSATPAPHPARHHLRRWDEDRRRARRNGDRERDDPGRRSHVHLLDPGPRAGWDEGGGHRRGRRTRHRAADGHGGPTADRRRRGGPERTRPVQAYDATAPQLLAGDDPRHRSRDDRAADDRRPGFVQAVWTFGGTVPGPVIRVKVGDTIRVHLKNPIENKMSHSIDFHASQVAWNDEMRSIAPGEELLYEWTADYAGVWMYHCGTAPDAPPHRQRHVRHGHRRAAGRLPKVDKEFAIVQSEWYLGPQGKESDLDKAMAAAPAPGFRPLQRRRQPVPGRPLKVGTGERVRIFVLERRARRSTVRSTSSARSSTRSRKEGIALAKGNAGNWGSQAMDLSPAQGAIVEFTTAEDGHVPDRHPCLQLRWAWRPRHAPGRRRRSDELIDDRKSLPLPLVGMAGEEGFEPSIS